MTIKFHKIPKELNEEQMIKNIKKLVVKHGGKIQKLEIFFVSREQMAKIHSSFLNDDETDTMTFNYGTKDRIITESYISPWFVKKSAEEINVPYNQELLRVVGHSVLHSLGLKDDTPQEKKKITALEDDFIASFPPYKHKIVPRGTSIRL